MAYKIQIENNFFIVIDTGTSAEIIREVRDQVKFAVSTTIYKFKWNYANGPDVSNQSVTEFDFADIVDSTLTPYASQAVLNAYLSSKIGKICCNPSTIDIDITDSASTTLYLLTVAEGGSATQPILDTTLEVNGTIEGLVVAQSTVDIQLSDSGGVVTPTSVTQVGNDFQIVLPLVKDLFWELNYNGTDDVIFIPATVNNVGTLTGGTGSNVGTITVSTDGVTYGALSFPFTPVATTTYYFKRSTATVTGSYTITGTYA